MEIRWWNLSLHLNLKNIGRFRGTYTGQVIRNRILV